MQKSKCFKVVSAFVAVLFSFQSFVYPLPDPQALPVGVTYTEPDSETGNYTSTLNHTLLGFDNFDVDSNEHVNFYLPTSSSSVLCLDYSGTVSMIRGSIFCNGTFMICNPNGIRTFDGSDITAQNVLLAGAQLMNPGTYIDGSGNINLQLARAAVYNDGANYVLNEGQINVSSAGWGVMIASAAHNGSTGYIGGTASEVQLACGDAVTFNLSNTGLINIAVTAGTATAIKDFNGNYVTDMIKNSGTINAATIILKADQIGSIFENAINLQGVQKAGDIQIFADGRIRLAGTNEISGQVNVSDYAGNDTALYLGTGTYSGVFRSKGDIIVEDLAVLNLTGNTTFWADSDADLLGRFDMDNTSSIYGNNYDLALYSSRKSKTSGLEGASFLGNLYDINTLTLNSSHPGVQAIYFSDPSLTLDYTTLVSNNSMLVSGLLGFDAAHPYEIWTLSDWLVFGSMAGGIQYAALMADIDFGFSLLTPIKTFSGTLFGNNHVLSNFVINAANGMCGLFKELVNATVRDLTLRNGLVTTRAMGGMLAAVAKATGSGFLNIINVTVEDGEVRGSSNTGYMKALGGMIGQLQINTGGTATIDGCVSSAWVHNVTPVTVGVYFGGLIGDVQMDNGILNLTNCEGRGLVSFTPAPGWTTAYIGGVVGGIVAKNGSVVNVQGCDGYGDVVGAYCTGGVIGNAQMESGSSFSMDDCNSFGDVAGGWTTGGLLGAASLAGGSTGSITNSISYSEVYGTYNVGGLIGMLSACQDSYYLVDNCSSKGTIQGIGNVGGLIGNVLAFMNGRTTIQNCIGYGNTSGIWNVGGLVGLQQGGIGSYAGFAEILNCSAENDVYGSSSVGGLVGRNVVSGGGTALISGSTTLCTITGFLIHIGGLVGYNTGTIDLCSSESEIDAATANNVGGLVGSNLGTIGNSSSKSEVTGFDNVGGLVGNNSGIVSGSTAESKVTGNTNVGGFAGINSGTIQGVFDTSDPAGFHVFGSFSNSEVNGVNNVGGFCGQNTATGILTTSASFGSTTATGTNAGGFVGLNDGAVSLSYVEGSTTGVSNVGGFVGNSNGSIENTYTWGSVNGTANVGGYAGTNAGTISCSYSAGAVNGTNSVGGFVGNDTGGVYQADFWDGQTAGFDGDKDFGNGGNIADTMISSENTLTMQTQTTFTNAGWDFWPDGAQDIWGMQGYPVFIWNHPELAPVNPSDLADNEAQTSKKMEESASNGKHIRPPIEYRPLYVAPPSDIKADMRPGIIPEPTVPTQVGEVV